jgi:hypothetical protein
MNVSNSSAQNDASKSATASSFLKSIPKKSNIELFMIINFIRQPGYNQKTMNIKFQIKFTSTQAFNSENKLKKVKSKLEKQSKIFFKNSLNHSIYENILTKLNKNDPEEDIIDLDSYNPNSCSIYVDEVEFESLFNEAYANK